jgi:hypothetical protein
LERSSGHWNAPERPHRRVGQRWHPAASRAVAIIECDALARLRHPDHLLRLSRQKWTYRHGSVPQGSCRLAQDDWDVLGSNNEQMARQDHTEPSPMCAVLRQHASVGQAHGGSPTGGLNGAIGAALRENDIDETCRSLSVWMQVGEDRFNKEEINRLYDEMGADHLAEASSMPSKCVQAPPLRQKQFGRSSGSMRADNGWPQPLSRNAGNRCVVLGATQAPSRSRASVPETYDPPGTRGCPGWRWGSQGLRKAR